MSETQIHFSTLVTLRVDITVIHLANFTFRNVYNYYYYYHHYYYCHHNHHHHVTPVYRLQYYRLHKNIVSGLHLYLLLFRCVSAGLLLVLSQKWLKKTRRTCRIFFFVVVFYAFNTLWNFKFHS